MPPETFIDFVPPPKDEIQQWSYLFSAYSLGAPVASCHAWSFRCNNKRRKKRLGTGSKSHVHTGLDCRALLVLGNPDANAIAHHPELVSEEGVLKEEEEGAAADEAEAGEAIATEMNNDSIKLHRKILQGWKVSYRQRVLEA